MHMLPSFVQGKPSVSSHAASLACTHDKQLSAQAMSLMLWNRSREILSKTTQKWRLAWTQVGIFQIWATQFTQTQNLIVSHRGEGKEKILFSTSQMMAWTEVKIPATHVCIVLKLQEWQTSRAKELTCHSIANLSNYFQLALLGFVLIKIIRHPWITDTGVVFYQLNQFQHLHVTQPFSHHFDAVLIADWLLRLTTLWPTTNNRQAS